MYRWLYDDVNNKPVIDNAGEYDPDNHEFFYDLSNNTYTLHDKGHYVRTDHFYQNSFPETKRETVLLTEKGVAR